MTNVTDILIIGGGVIGCALARELSRFSASVLLVDRAWDVAEGASKANSGIVHAGYDAVPGSLKAKYNVEGARLYPSLCEELSVPYRQCGALVVGFSEEDRDTLEDLLSRGEANGVPGLRIIGRDEMLALEPQLNPDACFALLVPTSGIVSPYELTFALADDAALNGVSFRFGVDVETGVADHEILVHAGVVDAQGAALFQGAVLEAVDGVGEAHAQGQMAGGVLVEQGVVEQQAQVADGAVVGHQGAFAQVGAALRADDFSVSFQDGKRRAGFSDGARQCSSRSQRGGHR